MNPFSAAWNAFTGLPEAIKAGGPVAILLFAALVAGSRGWWVYGATYNADHAQCTQDKAELKKDRDEYKSLAWQGTNAVRDRAEQSVKVNEQATQDRKQTVATVSVPVRAVTEIEKKAIEKPKDAEPATLQKTLDASQKVLQKTDISNAQVKKQ